MRPSLDFDKNVVLLSDEHKALPSCWSRSVLSSMIFRRVRVSARNPGWALAVLLIHIVASVVLVVAWQTSPAPSGLTFVPASAISPTLASFSTNLHVPLVNVSSSSVIISNSTLPVQRPGYPVFERYRSEEQLRTHIREGVPPVRVNTIPIAFEGDQLMPIHVVNAFYGSVGRLKVYLAALQLRAQLLLDDPTYSVQYVKPPPSSNANDPRVTGMIIYGPLVFSLAATLSFTVLSLFPIYDKPAKEFFFRAGLHPFHYWLSMYIHDFLLLMVVSVLEVLILSTGGVPPLSLFFGAWFPLLVLYSGVLPLLSYILSWPFSSTETAAKVLFSILPLFGMIFNLPLMMVALIVPEDAFLLRAMLIWTSILFPPTLMGNALIVMAAVWPFGLDVSMLYKFTDFPILLGLLAAQLILYGLLVAFFIYRRQGGLPSTAGQHTHHDKHSTSSVGVNHVEFSYKTPVRKRILKHALKGASLQVRRGTIFSLLGPNGSAKSTLMKILAGDLVPDSGTVSIMNMDVSREKWAIRSQCGFLDQQEINFMGLSATDLLTTVGRIRGVRDPHSQLLSLLADFDLLRDGLSTRPLATLSGGQNRKVALAAAILGPDSFPRVLFLDEPTSSIDPASQAIIHEKLRSLASSGTTIFLISHSMDEVELLSDDIAILVNGTVRDIGPKLTLQRKYGQGFELRMQGDRVLEALVELEHDFSISVTLNIPNTVHATILRSENATLSILFERLAQLQSSTAIEYTLADSSLDSVFVRFAEEQKSIN